MNGWRALATRAPAHLPDLELLVHGVDRVETHRLSELRVRGGLMGMASGKWQGKGKRKEKRKGAKGK
jgi:hypothetical protein